jgi:hypothetical protein
MKQLIANDILAVEREPSSPASPSFLPFTGLYAKPKLLSDESKVLLLTELYLELRLNFEQALRAARADMMMAPKAQTHRLWEEQLP